MKKLYFLSFIALIYTLTAAAQTTTVNIFSENTTDKTGYTTSTTAHNNQIYTTGTTDRGWAVFSLTPTIPAGTTLTACQIGVRVIGYTGSGTPSGWTTYGYVGDISSAFSTPATLYSDCVSGTTLSTATYGTATGNTVLPSTAASVAFATANLGGVVSICFTGGSSRLYEFEGYTGGTSTTGATHRPYISLSYCTGVTSVTATVSPIPVCPGGTLTLTGGGAGITSYSWSGPGGFTSTLESPTLTASAASAGVYTFTAYNSGGCATTVTTSAVTLYTAAGAVSGASNVCPGASDTLSDATPGGTWSVAPASIATISSTGVVTGISSGTATVTYGCGTTATYTVTVNTPPSAITGPDSACQGGTATLGDPATGGGTWSASPTSIATINNTTGILHGIAPGTATITFTSTSTGCYTTTPVIIDASPTPITGTPKECVGQTTTLYESVGGGTWSSANNIIATVDPSTGVVTGRVGATVNIIYTNHCGTASIANTVEILPDPITGRDSVCIAGQAEASDIYNGGSWTSSNPLVATVSGVDTNATSVYGVGAGTTTITYTFPDGCYITRPFTVVSLPLPITGPSTACPGIKDTLSDPSGTGFWTSTDSFVVVVDSTSGVVTGVSPQDTATIIFTLPAGCSVTKLITVNSLPVPILGISTLCAGHPDSLSNDSLGGTWSTSDPSIATVSAGGIVNTISGGTVTISYTLPTGCYVTASDLIHPTPVPSVVFNGTDATFTTDTFYNSYQWYAGTGITDTMAIPGAISHNVAGTYDQYYIVVVTDSFGCRGESIPYDLTNLSVKNAAANQTVIVYPNPATATIFVPSTKVWRAVVSDMAGRAIIEKLQPDQIDISKLASGVYIVSLFDNSGKLIASQKVTKQ